ncbi:hypothetical protein KI387_018948, partial [Taxus chinensis]
TKSQHEEEEYGSGDDLVKKLYPQKHTVKESDEEGQDEKFQDTHVMDVDEEGVSATNAQ